MTGRGRLPASPDNSGWEPEDVRRKKIAARAALMAQAGQYNVPRCLRRGRGDAALLATGEFVREGLYMAFLLNRAAYALL